MYKIYKYTNKFDHKVYIGQTSRTLKDRAMSNGVGYAGCTRFYSAILEYGWDAFEPEILKDGLTAEEANYWEEYYIFKYGSDNKLYGYNIMPGGENMKKPKALCRKISEMAKERYKDPTKNPMYGRHHSEESKQKMREKKVGANNYFYGKHHSEETKRKISMSNKGKTRNHKIWTDEDRKIASDKFKEIAKKWAKKVRCIEDDIVFEKIVDAAAYYGVRPSTLRGHLAGKQHTCANKHFEYLS